MKNRILPFILAIFIFVFYSSCVDNEEGCILGEDDDIRKEVMSISKFEGIDLEIDAYVFLKKGDHQKVEIQAQKNIIERINRSVSDDIWRIRFDRCILHHEDIKIFITLPYINYVEMNDDGKISTSGTFISKEINILSNGAGDIRLNTIVDYLTVNLNGSGNVELLGEAGNSDIKITGSGDLEAFGYETSSVDFNLRGSGNAMVYAIDYLRGEISGSGNLFYKGNPRLDVLESGSGDLIDAN